MPAGRADPVGEELGAGGAALVLRLHIVVEGDAVVDMVPKTRSRIKGAVLFNRQIVDLNPDQGAFSALGVISEICAARDGFAESSRSRLAKSEERGVLIVRRNDED